MQKARQIDQAKRLPLGKMDGASGIYLEPLDGKWGVRVSFRNRQGRVIATMRTRAECGDMGDMAGLVEWLNANLGYRLGQRDSDPAVC